MGVSVGDYTSCVIHCNIPLLFWKLFILLTKHSLHIVGIILTSQLRCKYGG